MPTYKHFNLGVHYLEFNRRHSNNLKRIQGELKKKTESSFADWFIEELVYWRGEDRKRASRV